MAKKESKSSRMWIADLVRRVAESTLSAEQAGICAYDCLCQWEEGGVSLLNKTRAVWNQRIIDAASPELMGLCDTERHGVWVPAIPLGFNEG